MRISNWTEVYTPHRRYTDPALRPWVWDTLHLVLLVMPTRLTRALTSCASKPPDSPASYNPSHQQSIHPAETSLDRPNLRTRRRILLRQGPVQCPLPEHIMRRVTRR